MKRLAVAALVVALVWALAIGTMVIVGGALGPKVNSSSLTSLLKSQTPAPQSTPQPAPKAQNTPNQGLTPLPSEGPIQAAPGGQGQRTNPGNRGQVTPAVPGQGQTTPNQQAPAAPAQGQAWLGVSIADIDDQAITDYNLDQNATGAVIAVVTAGSPAEQAGLQQGDVLMSVNGKAVASAQDVVTQVRLAKPGDVLTLALVRAGQQMTVRATAGSAPAAQPRSDVVPQAPNTDGATPALPDSNGGNGLDLGNLLDENGELQLPPDFLQNPQKYLGDLGNLLGDGSGLGDLFGDGGQFQLPPDFLQNPQKYLGDLGNLLGGGNLDDLLRQLIPNLPQFNPGQQDGGSL